MVRKFVDGTLVFVRNNAVFVVATLVVFALGIVLGSIVNSTFSDERVLGAGPESHLPYDATGAGEVVPSVRLEVARDTGAGWNLSLVTTDFTFTPDNTGAAHVAGEGHAHVYVDGQKLGRIYSRDYHIPAKFASAGQTVFVTLNTNDHRNYANGAEIVQSAPDLVLP